MNIDVNISAVISFVAVAAVGIIGWFLRKTFTDVLTKLAAMEERFELAAEKYSDHAVRVAVLEEKVERLERGHAN